MTYETDELSVAGGEPVELYRFTYINAVHTYCSGDQSFTLNGEVYDPYPIQRAILESTPELQRNTLEMTVPVDNPIALIFMQGPPEATVGFTLFREHRTLSGYITAYKGRVVVCEIEGQHATLSCDPIFTSLARTGLRRTYDVICPYNLYDQGCRVLRTPLEVNGIILGMSGLDITVQNAALFEAAYFRFGFVEIGAIKRYIIGHTGAVLTLMHGVNASVVGQSCVLLPGCDKLRSTCDAKFDNILNFGGWSWIPPRNPFTGDNIFFTP